MALNKEQLKTLESMKSADLRAWISQFIVTGDSFPLDLFFTGRSPVESFIVFVRDFLPDSSHRLRERIHTETANLAGSVAPDEDSKLDYLWDVITVATRLRAYHLKKVLLPVINGGEFRGRQGRSEDLHYCFIDTLAELGLSKREVSILRKRDIKDMRYATVAYRALYKADPEWALKYFPEVTHAVVRLEEQSISEMAFILEDLKDTFDMDFIINELPPSVIATDDQQCINLFFDALNEAFPDDKNELYRRIVVNLYNKHRWDVESHMCPPMTYPVVIFMNHVYATCSSKAFVDFFREYELTKEYGKNASYPANLNVVKPLLRKAGGYDS
jgi:hypothetical protein